MKWTGELGKISGIGSVTNCGDDNCSACKRITKELIKLFESIYKKGVRAGQKQIQPKK